MSETRIDRSEMPNHCFRSDHIQIRYVNRYRELAHEKHGDESIEAIEASDLRWLSILVEEVGEVAHSLTYDSNEGPQELANELVDVMTVCSAWLDALRVEGILPDAKGAWIP